MLLNQTFSFQQQQQQNTSQDIQKIEQYGLFNEKKSTQTMM